ncbi:MAG: dTDP-4-dehydrorhamnose 3,5-epimerase [Spirochaetaceae bacterium]
MPFRFEHLDIPGLILVEPHVFEDERGAFLETYKESDFRAAGITERFVQDNVSVSSRGVVRGLHMQVAPSAQGKLVSVSAGAVFDVAVDVRPGSATYGRWLAVKLAAGEHRVLYIPPGFAHGFQALEDGTRLSYKCTAEYDRDAECGIRFDDAELAVTWPLTEVLVSEKDRGLPGFAEFRAAQVAEGGGA